jgi:uncharacterized protein YggE
MKIVVFVLSLIFPLLASANPVPDFPFVIVTEKLNLDVKPDLATIGFSILAYDKSSEAAMNDLTKATAKMLDIVGNYMIPISQLESTQVDKSTKRAKRDGTYNLEVLGYEVRQGFSLRLTDLDKYPALMNALIRLDGLQNIDALFKTSTEDEYKEQMIAELSTKARNKADALAKAQSRKVKSVYGITSEGNFANAYAVFSLEYRSQDYEVAMELGRGSYGRELVMAVPEYIKVGQRITAIYELK